MLKFSHLGWGYLICIGPSKQTKKKKKIGQGLLLTGDPHVMVVPPKYFFHAINVQQLIYVLYNKKCKWYFLSQYFLSVCSSISAGTFCLTIVLHIKKTCKEHLEMAAIFGEGKIFLKIDISTFLRYPVGRKF